MIECRGRNGWFNLHEANATVYRDGKVAVRMESKQGYRDMPPIYLTGPKEEVLGLLDQLKAKIESETT